MRSTAARNDGRSSTSSSRARQKTRTPSPRATRSSIVSSTSASAQCTSSKTTAIGRAASHNRRKASGTSGAGTSSSAFGASSARATSVRGAIISEPYDGAATDDDPLFSRELPREPRLADAGRAEDERRPRLSQTRELVLSPDERPFGPPRERRRRRCRSSAVLRSPARALDDGTAGGAVPDEGLPVSTATPAPSVSRIAAAAACARCA